VSLTFDPVQHHYFWKGVRVPNVTSIIKPLTDYSMVPEATLELARQKGVAVHSMVELWAANELDYGVMPEWMFPVLDHWLQFVHDTGFQLLSSERRVYHAGFDYAGTLDLRCLLPKTALKGPGILDLKRSFMAGAAIGLQLAAYAAADNLDRAKADKAQWRAALRLREDSPPRLQIYEDKNDFVVFLACLTMWKWRAEHD